MSEHTKSFRTKFRVNNLDILSKICGTNNEHISVMEELLGNPIYIVGDTFKYISSSTENSEDFVRLCGVVSEACERDVALTAEYIRAVFGQLTGVLTEHSNMQPSTLTSTQPNNKTSIEADVDSNGEVKRQPSEELNRNIVMGDGLESGVQASSTKAHSANTIDDIVSITIPITGKQVVARTEGQKRIIQSLTQNLLSFLVGPAGTGKTYFATAFALTLLLQKKKERYIITRPVVEAGERLGFLPGDYEQKVLPYLRPIYDVLYELAGEEIVQVLQEKRQLEIAPLAYMRGRTLKNSIVLLDEAQNCTPSQMRMFLTRIGEGSICIVNGDLAQSDLHAKNGLKEAVSIFANTKHIDIVQLGEKDVQRSKLARLVVATYNMHSMQKKISEPRTQN